MHTASIWDVLFSGTLITSGMFVLIDTVPKFNKLVWYRRLGVMLGVACYISAGVGTVTIGWAKSLVLIYPAVIGLLVGFIPPLPESR